MRFGAHVPVGDGYDRALEYAVEVGCECMQIFAKSPRQWRAAPLDLDRARRFEEARAQIGFGPVFTHTAYLINIATSDPVIREKSLDALTDELIRGRILGVDGVVTHVGNDPDGDCDAAAARVGDAVTRAFELAGEGAPRLLLENTAGAGRTFGGSIEELAACVSAAGLPANMVGVCLDTCHAFAYGMPIDTPEGWDTLIAKIVASLGLERLGLIHANDCRYERGSHRDRHAWVGDGFIGEPGFSAMVCREELGDLCACIEVAGDVPEKDVENIRRLRALRSGCASSQVVS